MQLKKAILLSLTLLIALPTLAAASDAAPGEATVETPAITACDVEATPSADSETHALAGTLFAPEADAQQGGGCCEAARRQCEANCSQTGVFEFSCDPDTCSSSCICNIG